MGLQLADALRADLRQAGHAVGLGSLAQRLEARQLRRLEGHHELAGALDGDGVGRGEGFQLGLALAAEPGLERARGVVQAGVDDAAVVARLVGREGRLTLDEDQAQARSPAKQLIGSGEADDAPADDQDVGVVVGHGRSVRQVLTSSPMPSMATRTTSPSARKRGGSR